MPTEIMNSAFVNDVRPQPIHIPPFKNYQDQIYRHCKRNNLPVSDGSIKIGTFSEYRRIENSFVRDVGEAKFRINLDFQNLVKCTPQWLQQATLGTCVLSQGFYGNCLSSIPYFGRCNVGVASGVQNLDISPGEGGLISVRGQYSLDFESADAFMICFSKSKELHDGSLDPSYDSAWSIGPDSILEFAKRISKEILARLGKKEGILRETVGPFANRPGFFMPERDSFDGLAISFEIYEVEYIAKAIHVSSADDATLSEIYSMSERCYFLKEESFSLEREVRMIFRPLFVNRHDGKLYAMPNYLESLYLPANLILDLVGF